MQRDPALPPDPDGGWSSAVRQFQNAFVVPPDKDEPQPRSGVLSAQGAYVPRGATWRREVAITLPPSPFETPCEQLSGRWLWGGTLFNHFGHFLTESTARLWALNPEHDGIIFVPRKGTSPDLNWYQTELLGLLVGNRPIRLIRTPMQVQNLDVPGQGVGLGRIAGGTAVYRDFISRNFACDIRPEGPRNLFISRSGMSVKHGGFVGESILDSRMSAAGYTIFHPERHSIATQIARYRAARRIVGFDGSALHLLAMVARPDQEIAIILRRPAGKSSALRRQMAAFTGRPAHLVHALPDAIQMAVGKKHSIKELDLLKIGQELCAQGFIDADQYWPALTETESAAVDAQLEDLEA
jgi:hypothetical protein